MEQLIESILRDLIKIIICIMIGVLIGIERERSGKPAGMRTLSIVCMSSALLMMITLKYFPGEEARIVAGVLTGIGFLGAGTIIAHESNIIGLTTAAVVWGIAIIGICIGLGDYSLAIIFSIATYLILIERRIENKIIETQKKITKKRRL